MREQRIEDLLKALPKKHVSALVRHFAGAANEFRKGEWEDSIGKAGKFVEAVLKVLWVSAGNQLPAGRGFKVETIISGLANLPAASHDDSIRLLIPRACRFIYDIASNRGGRHDPEEVDPNEMDAIAALTNCSWILAEMIRFSQRGRVNLKEAKMLVDSLVEKKYPLVERVEGRVYFHGGRKSAPDVLLLALADKYPKRISEQELASIAVRHGFTVDNARVAMKRIRKYVDDDGMGQFRLLAPGLREADQIMDKLPHKETPARRRSTRRRQETRTPLWSGGEACHVK